MRIFIDIFTQDELISDSYAALDPFGDQSLRDVAFEVISRKVQKGNDDYGISANTDEDAAEGATGEVNDNVEYVIDVVDKFDLQEQSYSKKDFQMYIKKYIKNVCDDLEARNPERLAPFKAGILKLFQKVLVAYSDCSLYIGANSLDSFVDFKAHPIIAHYDGEEPTPRFIFITDALKAEKC